MNCKYCAHRRTCETSLHDDDYCADYRTSCPLPRIGSKEWGWSHGERKYSDKTDYYVRDHSIFNVNGGFVASAPSVVAAKRIAELLARRDRRKEQGKK